ncbi:nuclear transport factor 2 family protein [Croceivirga thetidis]|uniref:Nuclear transport factor 2 family protein n=1 Tax=Croceivirga thetidis TaxID=2721623 RepID=A0ABX1GT76_9FLAO|nr:nuclear transport factor 2 family protein [Croceivirga thetidis]NKI32246.1 nuclear transport factor 2 family protein [Croceivirga thetidis]
MKIRIILVLALLVVTSKEIIAQSKAITFQTNGLHSLVTRNPFEKFIGEWTLKDDSWTHNWGGQTETIKIQNHHTISTQINTANSLFSIIDGPQPNGHIFWSYNPATKVVDHLSSFGELRAGVGQGSVSIDGDVNLKIKFEGEPKDTYRIYDYKWLSSNEYHMKSVQYDSNDAPTGLFYEGNFIRLPNTAVALRNEIEAILSVLDNNTISVEEQLEVYADDVIHMAPGSEVNVGIEALGIYLTEQRQYGKSKMQHEIIEIEEFDDIVLMRGQVTGTFYPKNETPPVAFRTKNLFVFSTKEGVLRIKKVIYNTSPLP